MKLSPLSKKVISIILTLSAIGSIVSFVIWSNMPSIILGIIVGTIVSIYRFLSLERTTDKILNLEDKSKASNSARLGYLVRFFVTTAVCVFAAMHNHIINLFGVMFGVFTMQLSVYIYGYLEKRSLKKDF